MANQNVVQQVLQELADVEGLLKDNLISIEAYIGGCSSVLSQLVSSNKLTFAEKREALKAAKQQHQISQRVLQEAGKQLLDTKLQQLSFAAAAAADTPAGDLEEEAPAASASAEHGQPRGNPQPAASVSSFGDYGFESDAPTTDAESEGQADRVQARSLLAWVTPGEEQAEYDAEAGFGAAADVGDDMQEDQDAGVDSNDIDSEMLSDPDTDDADDHTITAADEQAISEITSLQKSTHLLLSRAAFAAVARDVLQEEQQRRQQEQQWAQQRHEQQQQGGQAGAGAQGASGGNAVGQGGPGEEGAGADAEPYVFDGAALAALQRAAEEYLVEGFEAANLVAVAGDRQKIRIKDLETAVRVSGSWRQIQGTAGRIW